MGKSREATPRGLLKKPPKRSQELKKLDKKFERLTGRKPNLDGEKK